MTDELEIRYSTGGTLAADAKSIIDAARSAAYRSVDVALVRRNWLLGRRIAEEVLKGEGRAEYGCTLSLVPGPPGAEKHNHWAQRTIWNSYTIDGISILEDGL